MPRWVASRPLLEPLPRPCLRLRPPTATKRGSLPSRTPLTFLPSNSCTIRLVLWSSPPTVVADAPRPQLYRVFRISPSFYLSQILFSPNSPHSPSTSQRILLGREVHNADEYNEHIAPYRGRNWPGALLKFFVYDETPHKSPTTSNNRISMLSTDSGHASLTSEGASSATVVDWEHAPRSPRRKGDDRKLFLERLRERTTTRTNVSPPSEPTLESPLISTASSQDDSTLRQSSRPLPRTPSPPPETESAASTITGSSKTTRPSLYDLLNREPTASSRVASRPETSRPSLVDVLRQDLAALSTHQSLGEDHKGPAHRPTHSISIDVVPPSPSALTDAVRPGLEEQPEPVSQRRRTTFVAPRRAWFDETVVSRPFSERRPRPRPISDYGPMRNGAADRPHRPSLAELMARKPSADALRSFEALHRPISERIDNLRRASDEALARARKRYEEDNALVIPPPPILSQSDIHIGQSPSFVVPPPPILYPSVGLTLPGSEVTPTAMPQRAPSPIPVLGLQAEVTPPQSPAHAKAPPAAEVTLAAELPACQGPSSGAPQREECCSVAQGKAEVKTLLDKFMSDLEGTMKRTFGDDLSINEASKEAGRDCGHPRTTSHRPQFIESPPDWFIPTFSPTRTMTAATRTPSPTNPPVIPPTPVGELFVVPPPPPPPMPPLPPFPGTQASMSVLAPVVPPPPPSWVPPPSWTYSGPAHQHPGITCDGCRSKNFYGIRYKCMDCHGMTTLVSWN